jgi:Na+/H+ antiporter NhaD/arsenite permease-like protein
MLKRSVLLLLVLLLCGSAAGGESPSDEKPAWALSDKPETIRGRITVSGVRQAGTFYVETASDKAYMVIRSADLVKQYLNLNAEVKGWTGEYEGIPVIQPVHAPIVLVPWWWSLPFLLLLGSIAIVPFIDKRFWEHHYHHIALVLGAIVIAIYVVHLQGYGQHRIADVGMEYFKFIALIGSLFVVSGGILIDVSGHGTPIVNTLLLGAGAVVANLFGTTGASALLIRPFLRINKDRMRPFHVVLFIFIVANCGGVLTPIGDPPLFLGYLNGVPFEWTIVNCWPAWLLTVGLLLVVFFLLDTFAAPKGTLQERTRVRISGAFSFLCLGVVLFAVFLDKILATNVSPAFEHYPLGAILMIAAAFTAHAFAKRENLARNEFTFGPIVEVAYLFAGIFATMVPALDYLSANAAKLGVQTPTGFYFASGLLSSVLDNAPTYLNFLTAAHGLKGIPLAPENMPVFISQHADYLLAISLGSVFFGACTYIGNGPNFMVKAIADASGAQTPGFFGYILKYTLFILLPIYVAVWLVFLR